MDLAHPAIAPRYIKCACRRNIAIALIDHPVTANAGGYGLGGRGEAQARFCASTYVCFIS
jgi:hypothetical protein